jgi:hypothetical protein
MRIKLVEVVAEKVQKGKNSYNKATVTYSYNGENRTHSLVSFANPAVFATLQECNPGDDLDVEITKNSNGYNQWSKLTKATGAAPAATPAPTGGKVLGNNFETKEERSDNRVRIVRQSALNYAINTLTPGAKSALKYEEVVELAQKYVDWVYDSDFEEISGEQVQVQ